MLAAVVAMMSWLSFAGPVPPTSCSATPISLLLPVCPNAALTPGVAGPLTAKDLCSPTFHTASVRHVTAAERRQVFAEYHLGKPSGAYEVDHLVSLELGGTNDLKNLWPEAYAGAYGARTKDVLENRLHEMVCAGSLSLLDAQHDIETDWLAAFGRYVKVRTLAR